MLINILRVVGIGILTSLFFFPFNPSLMPSINTKMALAVIGLLLMLYNGSTLQKGEVRSDLLKLTLVAIVVSVTGLIATTINDTQDYTYATYVVSMWVWLSGAYTVIYAMRRVYVNVTFRILVNYLIAVCIAQCFLAQLIHYIPAVAEFIDGIMVSYGYMGKMESRLYGLGCALDVAGLKFSGVLIIIMYMALHESVSDVKKNLFWYIFAFVIITILGSMIARTTSVGAMLAIGYLIFNVIYHFFLKSGDYAGYKNILKTITCTLLIIVPICVTLYRYNESFKQMFDFGFEGFFSLVESGKWEVRSNDQLLAQWYWPDNSKTWIIGDGYFDSPNEDPYYIGESYEGFYKGTDVGWCRFVFYFGLVGLVSFVSFFIYLTILCGRLYPSYKLLFWLLLLMNFIGWSKVSSDIFPIYAMAIMLGGSVGQNNLKLCKQSCI